METQQESGAKLPSFHNIPLCAKIQTVQYKINAEEK